MSSGSLNETEEVRRIHDLIRTLHASFGRGATASTSFGSTAGLLIHFISETKLPIPVVHVNTGFLFPETRDYVAALKARYTRVAFLELKPDLPGHAFLKIYGREIHCTNPDLCCRMNKVEPFNRFLDKNRIKLWITAVRKDQTGFRGRLRQVELLENGMCKAMPFLNWSSRQVHDYMKQNNIPFHPLYERGFSSIGCEPCTSLPSGGDERSGRWKGSAKTECGLHLAVGKHDPGSGLRKTAYRTRKIKLTFFRTASP